MKANIINLQERNNEETLNKIKDTKVLEGFAYLLEMPDELFNQVLPTMKEEIEKTLKSGEMGRSIVQEGSSPEEIEENLQQMIELKEEINHQDFLSKEKKGFLLFVIDAIIGILLDIPYRDKVKVKIELCNSNAKIPTYATDTDAGCDVYAIEDTEILPHETKIIPTGLKVAIPIGWMLSVRPRSGVSAKTGIRVANAPGTIDPGYREEVGIILHNTSDEIYLIKEGDRIAQFVIEQSPMIDFEEIDDISEIKGDRGGGFGHSGT